MVLLDSAGVDRAKKLMNQNGFKSLKTNVKIALIVNAAHESGVNPSAMSNDGGGGIWQWTPWQGKVTPGDWQGQVDYMLADAGQYIAHSGWWAAAGVSEPASMANVNSWSDFLKSGASAVDLTIAFIGNWERPAYVYGVQRVNSAQADVSEVQNIEVWRYNGESQAAQSNNNNAPVVPLSGAVDQTLNVGDFFKARPAYRVDEFVYTNGVEQVINYELAGGKDFDWTNNGIGIDSVDKVDENGNKTTDQRIDVGDYFRLHSDRIPVKEVDEATNGVAFDTRYGRIWASAATLTEV